MTLLRDYMESFSSPKGRPDAGCSAPACALRRAHRARGELPLDLDTDGPNEAGELAGNCGHRQLLALAAPHEPCVAGVQPVLRLPGDLLHSLARVLLPPPQFAAQVGPVAIGPGSLDEDAP